MNLKSVLIFGICFGIASCFYLAKKNKIDKNCTDCNNQVLIVGTSADYPPFAAVDPKTNKIVGFDIDIVTEIAKRLDKKIEIKDIPFAGLIFSLLSGGVAVVAAGISPSEKRAQFVAFSEQYMQPDPLVIIFKKSKALIQGLDDLIGKKVSVNSGYTAETYLSEKKGIDLVRLDTATESIMALKSGAADAFVCAQSVVNTMLGKECLLQDFDIVVVPETGDGCALVVHKNNIKLLDEINVALDAMIQDGTLASIQAKWNLK